MEAALYDPRHGYYAAGRAAIGRGCDFFTSVSVGPLFGRLLATQFEEMWERLERPARYAGRPPLARIFHHARSSPGTIRFLTSPILLRTCGSGLQPGHVTRNIGRGCKDIVSEGMRIADETVVHESQVSGLKPGPT